ncbi:hypothetical protein D9M68_947140 [compost metagenome]
MRHPLLRIGDFPILVFVGASGHHVRMLIGHSLPGTGIAFLERQSFGIRPARDEHRVPSLALRAKDVGSKHKPVIHLNAEVPVNPHAVSNFAFKHRVLSHLASC